MPNAFTVGLGSNGAFSVYTLTETHFIVDITGYYAPPGTGGLYYHPLPSPVRLLDTRGGQPACDAPGAPLAGGSSRTQVARVTCSGETIPARAQAVVGNATVVHSTGSAGDFVTLYPSGAAQPTVSNLNYVPGQVVPNAFTVGLGSDGAFRIFPSSTINFIVDLTGYFAAETGATGVTFYSDPGAFAQAAGALSTLNFEGITSNTIFQQYGASATIGGVTFSSVSGQAGSTGNPFFFVVGRSAPYGLSNFDSALLSEGNRNPIIVTLPSGKVALGLFVGSIEDTVTIPNNLQLTLTGPSGTLDTRVVNLGSMGAGLPHTFVGYIVSGDTINGLRLQTTAPSTNRSLGIDDVRYNP